MDRVAPYTTDKNRMNEFSMVGAHDAVLYFCCTVFCLLAILSCALSTVRRCTAGQYIFVRIFPPACNVQSRGDQVHTLNLLSACCVWLPSLLPSCLGLPSDICHPFTPLLPHLALLYCRTSHHYCTAPHHHTTAVPQVYYNNLLSLGPIAVLVLAFGEHTKLLTEPALRNPESVPTPCFVVCFTKLACHGLMA